MSDEADFLYANKHESFIQIDTMGKASQNNKFAISLQYLKENVKNEDDFLPCR